MLLVCIIPAITNAKTVTTFKAASRYMSSKLRQAQIPAQLSLTTTNNYSSKTVCKKVLNSMIDYDDDVSNKYMGDYTSSEIVDRVRIRVSKKSDKNNYRYNIKVNGKLERNSAAESKFRRILRGAEKKLNLSNESRLRKLRLIHDYVAKRIIYTRNLKFNNAYNALLKKRSACLGYSNLFYLMCRDEDIPCRVLCSKTHAWNIVKVNNHWYNIDVTWDDGFFLRHNYFLKGTEAFSDKDHKPLKEFKSKKWKKQHPMSKKSYPFFINY